MKTVLVSLMAAATLPLFAQKDASIRIYPEQGNQQISKHIYGQFAEHLGTCIYGGLWVGPESEIPNTQGYRNDVLNALKELKIPNLRWPGGCFADEYHWMDGIGPKENRPKMVNNNWGGTIEDNSFGTHEFLNLCELLGCEPYISANVGSGTVEEMAKWVEYMTSEGDSPMARLRRQNGRDKAWKVKFIGVGNESWGCGGSMRPEYYADLYRRYSTYCRNYDGQPPFQDCQRSQRLRLQLDGDADEERRRPHGWHLPALLHGHGMERKQRIGYGFQQGRLLLDNGQMSRNRRCRQEAYPDHGQIRPAEEDRPDGRRVGNLVGRRAGHDQRPPVPAEHHARCFRGSPHFERIP